MMKRNFLIILLWGFGYIPILAQESSSARKVNEFVIEENSLPVRTIPIESCNNIQALGIVIYTTTIPNINFEIQNAPNLLMNINHDLQNNQYILCIKPLEGGGYDRKFQIHITCNPFFEGTFHTISINASEVKSFKINPKEDPIMLEYQEKINNIKNKQFQPGYMNSPENKKDIEDLDKLRDKYLEIRSTMNFETNEVSPILSEYQDRVNDVQNKLLLQNDPNRSESKNDIFEDAKEDKKPLTGFNNINNKIVTGKIVDSSGESLIGCSIIEKGTTNGTISNIDGVFELKISRMTTISIAYLGYNTQEIIVSPGDEITVTLKEFDFSKYRRVIFDWKTVRGNIMLTSKLNYEQNLLKLQQTGFQLGWIGLKAYGIPYLDFDLTPMFEQRNLKLDNDNIYKFGFINFPIDIQIAHRLRAKLINWRYMYFPISFGPSINFKLYGDKTIDLNDIQWETNSYNIGLHFKAGISAYNATLGVCYSIGLTKEFTNLNDNKGIKGNYLYLNASFRF